MLIISKDTTLLFSFLNTVWCMLKPYLLTQRFCTAKKNDQALFQNAYILFYVLHKNSTSSSNITTSTSFSADKQEIKMDGLLQIPTLLNTWTTPFCLQGFSILQHIPPGHILRQQKFPLGPISKKTIIKFSNH